MEEENLEISAPFDLGSWIGGDMSSEVPKIIKFKKTGFIALVIALPCNSNYFNLCCSDIRCICSKEI